MRTFLYTMFALSAMLQRLPGNAQQTTKGKIEGIWKGTSICQQKQSACHDENVLYHISKKAVNLYTMQARKIVTAQKKTWALSILLRIMQPSKHSALQ